MCGNCAGGNSTARRGWLTSACRKPDLEELTQASTSGISFSGTGRVLRFSGGTGSIQLSHGDVADWNVICRGAGESGPCGESHVGGAGDSPPLAAAPGSRGPCAVPFSAAARQVVRIANGLPGLPGSRVIETIWPALFAVPSRGIPVAVGCGKNLQDRAFGRQRNKPDLNDPVNRGRRPLCEPKAGRGCAAG